MKNGIGYFIFNNKDDNNKLYRIKIVMGSSTEVNRSATVGIA